jgi:anthranilate synthase component I
MTFDSFAQLAKTYTAVPVHRILMADVLTPVSLFLTIREGARHPFLLESVEGGEHLARYSFIGRNPYQVLTLAGGKLTVERDGAIRRHAPEAYFDVLEACTREYTESKMPDLPRFTAGAVGFSGYDTVRFTERLPNAPADDRHLPDAQWGFYDEVFAFDHVKHRVILIKTVRLHGLETDLTAAYEGAQEALDRMQAVAEAPSKPAGSLRLSDEPLTSNIRRERFTEMVETAKRHIYEGDIFQVVLSQRFRKAYEGDRFMLYRALRMVNPSPYLFYLDFGPFALVGSSPEVLVRVQNGEAEVLPIAGTRKRGKTEVEDRRLEADLLADPKELAEHIMLVDLGRNDLSRICASSTVKVVRERFIVRYSHVMHIVSDVRGRLADGMSAVDALKWCFPAGTVSGAPKVRAMEIIDALEPTRRGPYAGAVGYFDFSGNMDTCIAIRTMVATDTDITIQAGAGIVADSVADNEYDETVNKAGALVEALGLATRMTRT